MIRESALALAAAIAAAPAMAQPAGTHDTCFPINQMRSWKAADNKTIFIRVNSEQFYRLDLAGVCAMLTLPNSHLITNVRGGDLICSALDWDLAVSEPPPGAIPEHCIVKQMTLLTPEEAAAIPKKFRP